MHRITTTGRVNLGHLFWLRSFAIIGQLGTIAVVQFMFGVHLPLPAMLLVIALEVVFNGLTWFRVAREKPESNLELFGQIWVDLGALSALLFLSGGTTNPFVSLYLPSLAIAMAISGISTGAKQTNQSKLMLPPPSTRFCAVPVFPAMRKGSFGMLEMVPLSTRPAVPPGVVTSSMPCRRAS